MILFRAINWLIGKTIVALLIFILAKLASNFDLNQLNPCHQCAYDIIYLFYINLAQPAKIKNYVNFQLFLGLSLIINSSILFKRKKPLS
ncbi:hypothetical protein D6029_14105 [Buttiauxella izardii]|uniref:Uncharacterized protein n=1 Tax=Buttiauxella izardii TaxID=82991 RepID=A0A3A5JNZ6_9ENTR|nr:hypothetical protein D6029_14105 [Buttiauxella izardii]